jgi:hypothetical protein
MEIHMNKFVITVLVTLATWQLAHAESTRPQGVLNQSSVYEQTLKFPLHPARLEWRRNAPSESGEHPAVIAARNFSRQDYGYAAKFYLHPARLELAREAPS